MNNSLHIGSGFALPLDVVTTTIAILGLRGSGKSNTATVLAEEMATLHLPFVVIDPTDAWWGLRTGFPVFIFGGSHGDLPLQETDGRVIAEFLVTDRVPVILSLRHLKKAAQRRFVADFLEELYHLKGKDGNRTPLTVFIDEAPLFVPQRVTGESARVVGAVEDTIARGRNAGFGVVLISQRSATVNKDVLTQSDVIITHRLTSPQDKKALGEWFEDNADSTQQKEIFSSLAGLPNGKAWVWAPTLSVMQQVQVRRRNTFDSGSTPKLGEVAAAPKRMQEVDLGLLKEKLAASVQAAKENDPRELKAEVARLKQELVKAKADQAPAQTVPNVLEIEVPILDLPNRLLLEGAKAEMELLNRRALEIIEMLARVETKAKMARREIGKSTVFPSVPQWSPPAPPRTSPPAAVKTPRTHALRSSLVKSERAILTALAQFGPSSKAKVAAVTGYAVTGGGFLNALSSLRTASLIDRNEPVSITGEGMAALGNWTPLPTGQALQQYWIQRLSKAEAAILQYLCGVYPSPATKSQIAEAAGYEASGGGFLNALSALRTLELINRGEPIKASDNLF